MLSFIRKLGPGLLFAGAAIGVSHLVQSTRAGADYGYALLWALFVIHFFKYPFFQFAPRYTTATGENLIQGYQRLGKPLLWAYFFLTITTMFTIQAAVTLVTAGLASYLFGIDISVKIWTIIIIAISVIILIKGRYGFLDKLMKVIVVVLTLTSLTAVVVAFKHTTNSFSLEQVIPTETASLAFLIAFLGWMPAPLDVSVWQSLWTNEKQKQLNNTFSTKQSIFDFNVGYVGTILTGVLFMSLGALAMFHSGEHFSPKAGVFAGQLINIYTQHLGSVTGILVAIAAFTTMFSTTITTLDASPRAMSETSEYLFGNNMLSKYWLWLTVLSVGTIFIVMFFISNMGLMVKIATIVSFITAPFYAIANLLLVTGKHMPKKWRPNLFLKIWSVLGIFFLIGFSVWYLIT